MKIIYIYILLYIQYWYSFNYTYNYNYNNSYIYTCTGAGLRAFDRRLEARAEPPDRRVCAHICAHICAHADGRSSPGNVRSSPGNVRSSVVVPRSKESIEEWESLREVDGAVDVMPLVVLRPQVDPEHVHEPRRRPKVTTLVLDARVPIEFLEGRGPCLVCVQWKKEKKKKSG